MKSLFPVTLAAFAAGVATLHAGSRSSASYTIPAEVTDAGGGRAISVRYTHDGSMGAIAGTSAALPSLTLTAGFLSQLSSAGFMLTAASRNVPEGSPVQLSATIRQEDGTEIIVPAASVAWSVHSGPISAINAGGLATAGLVALNTVATVMGTYNGQTAALGITVMDTIPDNFGSYAGDGLPDDWQTQFFGVDHPLAGPASDPDGDGHSNQFEFTAGLVPTDSLSRFLLRVDPVLNMPAQKNVVFAPIVAGRTYTVEFAATSTSGPWALLTGAPQSDNGSVRTVTDTNAAGPKKFYRVMIRKQ
jgi:hypothetical protein